MNLLELCQDAASRMGIVSPTQIFGSASHDAISMLALAQQEGKELARRRDWERLIKEHTWVATATEEQAGQFPSDVDRIIPRTFWNRTQDRPVAGPISPQRWQLLQSGLIIMPWDGYRLRGSTILMNPIPSPSDAMVYEYVTRNWCGDASSTDPTQAAWQADTDIAFLDEEIITLGIIWRWRKARKLDYGEDFRLYEDQLSRVMINDGGHADLNMGLGDDGSAVVDPYVNDGNWSIN